MNKKMLIYLGCIYAMCLSSIMATSDNEPNFYAILELNKNATKTLIKEKRNSLALKFHPDKNQSKPKKEKEEDEKRMKQINEAYEVLSNDFSKQIYDIHVYPGGEKAWDESLWKKWVKAQKPEAVHNIQEIEKDFEPMWKYISQNKLRIPYYISHDKKGRNYLQRYYIDSKENFVEIIAMLSGNISIINLLLKCLEETYRGKTIFYQALEEQNIPVIFEIINLKFLDFFNLPIKNDFFNLHPSRKPHPLKLFLKISHEQLATALEPNSSVEAGRILHEVILERFIENGLDIEGKLILLRQNRTIAPESDASDEDYFTLFSNIFQESTYEAEYHSDISSTEPTERKLVLYRGRTQGRRILDDSEFKNGSKSEEQSSIGSISVIAVSLVAVANLFADEKTEEKPEVQPKRIKVKNSFQHRRAKNYKKYS